MLPLFKPEGMVSKDVSRFIEKKFGRFKIGHVGTLDPLASGVLPLMFGKATKFQDKLLLGKKEYICKAEIGYETDSCDKLGKVVNKSSLLPDDLEETLKACCNKIRGDCEQTPPIYSAIKYNGRPLYDYARKDESHLVPLENLGKVIQVHECELLDFKERGFMIRLLCSKGTYVRSVVRDIGREVGCLATMISLQRIRSSGIHVEDCLKLEELGGTVDEFKNKLWNLERLKSHVESLN